ncbi:Uncharacterised protein [Mycobacteroides abscessus subsp. abscessus]|nr:Uncharacterised protein [Mycobacteroides abscessus subsp. abscessus]
MRVATCSQKSATEVYGEVVNLSGTTPELIPGTSSVSGRTRRLTGKSSTTSAPPTSPCTSRAHAAVITAARRTPNACDNSRALATTAGSN